MEAVGYGAGKINVIEEDVEDAVIHAEIRNGYFDDRELLEFLEQNIDSKEGHPEYYRTLLQDMFVTNKLTSNTIFVENPVTGTFSAVSTGLSNAINEITDRSNMTDENKKLEGAPLLSNSENKDYPELGKKALLIPPTPIKVTVNDAEELQARRADEWTLVTMEYRNFAFIRRLGFLVFQGLLAGFAVVTVYVGTSSARSDTIFLESYQSICNEIRRYFFILTVISLTGSIDYFYSTLSVADARYSLIEYLSANVASKWADYQKISMTTSFILVILYAIAFLVTLIMSRFDVMVYLENDIVESDWTVIALEDATFTSRMEQWKTLDQVRLASVLLAWLGSCVLLWMDISRYSKLWLSLRTMRTTALSWMRRAKALEGGKELDNMALPELKEVVAALEIGLIRAKGALQLKEDLAAM